MVVMFKLTVLLLLTVPNVQLLCAGNPEQAKLPTLEALRPPTVVMVMVVGPLCPGADIDTVVGLADSVKPCAPCTTCCTAGDVLVVKFASPL